MRIMNSRKIRRPLTIPEVKREVSKIATHLADVYERLPANLPEDVALQIAGSFKFMQMTSTSLMVAESAKDLAAERALSAVVPVIREAVKLGFQGFGGNCFAAAVAMNRVLFDGKLAYYIAVNQALYDAGRSIGHVTLFTRDGKGARRHIDADGRFKIDVDVQSWGILDFEDPGYQEIASDLGVEWTERKAANVCFFEGSESDVLAMLKDKSKLFELESTLRRAQEHLGLQVTPESSGPTP